MAPGTRPLSPVRPSPRFAVVLFAVVAVLSGAWWVLHRWKEAGEKATPEQDAQFLSRAQRVELLRPNAPRYRLELTAAEKASLAVEILLLTGPEEPGKYALMSRGWGVQVDGRSLQGFQPGWRVDAAVLRRLPELTAAMDAIRGEENGDRDLLSRVLAPRDLEGFRATLPDADDLHALDRALMTLVRKGDEALRWSPADRAFLRGRAERPLFARFRRES